MGNYLNGKRRDVYEYKTKTIKCAKGVQTNMKQTWSGVLTREKQKVTFCYKVNTYLVFQMLL